MSFNPQPFAVAGPKSGIARYFKPWLSPEDALVDMQDCYCNQGQINKRHGYNLLGLFSSRIGVFNVGVGDSVTTTFNTSITPTVGKRSLAITHTQGGAIHSDGIDDGAGVISGTNIAAGSTINYGTGAITLNFTLAPTINTPIYLTYGIYLASGDGVTTTFPFTLSTSALPMTPSTLFIRNTSSNQNTAPIGDTPDTTTGLTGALGPGTVGMSGSVTYATSVGTVTFNTAPPAAAADSDIWARWGYQENPLPIKGIKFYWLPDSTQQTVIMNSRRLAVLDNTTQQAIESGFPTIKDVSGTDIFNTSSQNFFSVANYQNKLWMLNNDDRLTVYDGNTVFQPIISFTNATPATNELSTGKHVLLYRNRLVVFGPTESGTVKPQRARFSALNNPLDWVSDTQGHGGFVDAPTNEWIVAYEFLRDEIVVLFQNSVWKLRWTGIDNSPFRWQKLGDTRRVDCPYATVGYQDFVTSVGGTGLLKCDGVNQERYDDKIIDFVYDEIEQENFSICQGYRFDDFNQQFMSYSFIDSDITDYSTNWLVWNFYEESFSIWNINSTCFGAYYQSYDLTWSSFIPPLRDWSWSDLAVQNATWLSYYSQKNAKIPIFGSKTGQIFELNPQMLTDNGTRTGFSFTTTDFNPFVKQDMQARLFYVDFYFDSPSDDSSVDTSYTCTISFYVNENESPYKTLVFNPSLDNWKKKRVYCNAVGNFHRFSISLSDAQIASSTMVTKGFGLNGWIWYATPCGRLVG